MDNITVITDLKKALTSKFGSNIKEIILFGSRLTSEQSESDYDILILLKEKPTWKTEREISDICYEIDLKYGIITDTHILCEEDLKSPRGRQPVFANALSCGLHV